MVLSLQGCMAVGKTTAARYLQHHTPQVQVFFESTGDVIQQVRSRQLDKKQYPDYLEIQKTLAGQRGAPLGASRAIPLQCAGFWCGGD